MKEELNRSKVKLGNFDSTVGLDRGAGKIKEICWYFTKMIFFLSAFPWPSSIKCSLLRFFGAKVGSGVNIKPRVNIHFPWKLVVGNDVWIGE
ncbi:MAG: colanic acid biosynthesis acetyltransferase WcaF, partial [Pedobacter sp.]